MPLPGRNIPMSSLFSPFQSPMTGMSPDNPQLRILSETSQIKFPFASRLHLPLPGRNTPILVEIVGITAVTVMVPAGWTEDVLFPEELVTAGVWRMTGLPHPAFQGNVLTEKPGMWVIQH